MSDEASDDDRLPSYEDMKRYLEEVPLPDYPPERYEENYQAAFDKTAVGLEEDFAHLNGVISHYRHKGAWSYFLMAVMAGLVIFQSVLLGMVGARLWDFTDYDWLLPLLLVQNFAQIIGLAVFVVKALFKPIRK